MLAALLLIWVPMLLRELLEKITGEPWSGAKSLVEVGLQLG